MPLFSKNKNIKNNNELENERKIEFSQKLSISDMDDLPKQNTVKKTGNFNFLKEEAVIDDKKTPFKNSADNPIAPKSDNELIKKNNFFSFLKKRKGIEKGVGITQSDILEVDLVKGEIVKYFDWQKNLIILFISVFLSILIISFVYWIISWQGSKITYSNDMSSSQEYYRLDKEIKKLEEDAQGILNFKQKIDLADKLLNSHIYWTNFFNLLEENTLSNVYFSSFAGDIGGKYMLSARSNDFDAIDAQIKKFISDKYITDSRVSAGVISGADSENPSVSFDLYFSINPSVFIK